MADLTEIQSAQSVKIIGSDLTGVESFPVNSDSAGNLNTSISATKTTLSTSNSSTVQLAAAATFNGIIEDISNQKSYSIKITSDQNGTLVVNQYIDSAGLRLVQTNTYSILANTGFLRANTCAGNYLRISFTNNGASTTTTLNINTHYGFIESTTQLNNFPISVQEVNGSSLSLGTKVNSQSIPVTLSQNLTYSASVTSLVPAATPTDIFNITGSATKKIKISKLILTATQTTAAVRDILLIKRSTLNTGGTSTVITKVSLDSTNIAATATVRSYTANPTALGTTVGTVFSKKILIGTATANVQDYEINFTDNSIQNITLNNANENLSINLNSITSTGGLINISIYWTEE